jgi:hypothetical protein
MKWVWVLVLCCAGCTTTVIPPTRPVDPVTVYLTDYGRHSSILLPTDDNEYTEYAFGDWKFFAEGHTHWWTAIRATLGSPRSTLGRREIAYPGNDLEFRKKLRCVRLMKFQTSKQAADVLALNLDRPFRISTIEPVASTYSKLNHVYDDTHYWGCHNCNHVTAEWLRQLDCQVHGFAILSTFEAEDPL